MVDFGGTYKLEAQPWSMSSGHFKFDTKPPLTFKRLVSRRPLPVILISILPYPFSRTFDLPSL
jgi:hypothetical protein